MGNEETPGEPPGVVRTARVLVFVASALVLLTGLTYVGFALGDPTEVERTYRINPVTLGLLGAAMLAVGGTGVALGLRLDTGGPRVRAGALAWSGFAVAVGLGTAPLGLITVVLGALVLWYLTRAPSRDWFERSRP